MMAASFATGFAGNTTDWPPRPASQQHRARRNPSAGERDACPSNCVRRRAARFRTHHGCVSALRPSGTPALQFEFGAIMCDSGAGSSQLRPFSRVFEQYWIGVIEVGCTRYAYRSAREAAVGFPAEHPDSIGARVADPVTDDHARTRRAALGVTGQPTAGWHRRARTIAPRSAVVVVQPEALARSNFMPTHLGIAFQCRQYSTLRKQ